MAFEGKLSLRLGKSLNQGVEVVQARFPRGDMGLDNLRQKTTAKTAHALFGNEMLSSVADDKDRSDRAQLPEQT